MRTAFGQQVMATALTGGALSTTILARTDHGPVSPLARIQRRVTSAPQRKPRRPSGKSPSGKSPSGKAPRKARRLRSPGPRTDLVPRVMDPQIRSVILWSRDYR